MSTFSAQDQSKMSLLFTPFGYLVSTSGQINTLNQLMPWGSFLLSKVDRSSVLKVKFARMFYDIHFFTFLSVID